MRTTVRLNEALLRAAKQRAADTQKTLTAVLEDALRGALVPRRSIRPRGKVRLKTVAGSGLLPGVDLDDSAALLDSMER